MTVRRALVATLLLGTLVALHPLPAAADTPPPTDPVSTVSTVTTPATTPVPVPKPDPAPAGTVAQRPHPRPPAHVATTPRPAPVVTPAPAPVRPAVQPAPVRAAVPVHHARPTVKRRPHRTVHTSTHRPKRAPHRAATPASRKAPVHHARKQRPAVVAVSVSSQEGGGTNWALPGALAGITLLVGAGVGVAAGRRTRRTAPATAGVPAAPPPQALGPPPPAPAVEPPPVVRRVAPAPPIEPVVPVVPVEPTCRIEWWRGYVRSQFTAFADSGTPIASSTSFAWRSKDPPPERDDAVAALAGLVDSLVGLGWTPDGRGEQWFSLRFVERAAAAEPAAEEGNEPHEDRRHTGITAPAGRPLYP